MTAAFSYDRFGYEEFDLLVRRLRDGGCTFHECLSLGTTPVPRGVAFRYDIHARDIAGAYSFLAVHYHQGIPGTFFLMAEYAAEERRRGRDFDRLARYIQRPLGIGLHDSPVDSHLIARRFGGGGIEYWRWLRSPEALDWLAALGRSEPAREQFLAEVEESFCERVARAKARFGEFSIAASHGGELNQMFRERMPELGVAGDWIASLFAENWLTPERLRKAGLRADVEQFKRLRDFHQLTDGGGRIRRLVTALETSLDRDVPIQLLLHPYTWGGPYSWSGGVRDAEISVLLGARPAGTRLGGRWWWQRVWRARRTTAEPRSAATPRTTAAPAAGIVVSATPAEIAADTRSARLPSGTRALIADAEPRSPRALLDYAPPADPERGPAVAIGRSIGRHGGLVAGAIGCLAGARNRASGDALATQQGLARWMRAYCAQDNTTAPNARLTWKEFSYFLFSSSQRAQVLKRVLDYFAEPQSIPCLVDHGAGIATMALCVRYESAGRIGRVECSEVKPAYVSNGMQLWSAVGWGDVIRYQKCSATDFTYPAEVGAVVFGQMLFRIPKEKRRALLAAAWEALAPGGLLIVNEAMNRNDAGTAQKLLTSDELIGYLPKNAEARVFWNGAKQAPVELSRADASVFRHWENFIAVRK